MNVSGVILCARHASAVSGLYVLVSYMPLVCPERRALIRVVGATLTQENSSTLLPEHLSSADPSVRCMPRSLAALLCLLTTTMALLKPPTPGECFCGKTRISLIDADAIVSSSICHCSVCRRLCGAPFCANLLTPRSTVHKS